MEDLLSLFEEELSQWFLDHGWKWANAHTKELIPVIATLILGVMAGLGWLLKHTFQYWLRRKAASDLLPYYNRAEVRKYTRYFIPTRVQGTSPSDQTNFKKLQPSEPYIDYFIQKVFRDTDEAERFHLVLGGAGMGKTAFMINLAIRYRTRLMLRPWETKYLVHYLPLWEKDVIGQIGKIEKQERSILLLDALDEDPEAHANVKDRIKPLAQAAARFHTVILTSRTQFFDTLAEEKESAQTGVYRVDRYLQFDKVYVAPFSEKEIKKYLRKRFRIDLLKRRKAWHIVEKFRDIMARPMILTYIDDLLKSKQQYQFKFQVYERIIDEWVKRESDKPHVSPGQQNEYQKNLRAFSHEIAALIYQRHQAKAEQFVSDADFHHLATQQRLKLEPKEMKSKSLLTRNSAAQWKFAHKSIMEYFLAQLAYDGVLADDFSEEFDFATSFLDEMTTIPQMVKVEGETFQMGSSNGEDDEKPVHEVTLNSFEIGKYPVTQRQWEAIMGSNPSHFKGPDRPVEEVSWKDCQKYIQKLNQKTGLTFRLPTEAEWEYAAGGGADRRTRYAGTDSEADLGDYAWYHPNSNKETHPVGQKKPNALGLYDLSGNVWEWCQDHWHDNYDGAPTDGSAWEDRADGSDRVLRGGSWYDDAGHSRVAFRNYDHPDDRLYDLGFRLARSLDF